MEKRFTPQEENFILEFSSVSLKSSLSALSVFNIQVELAEPSLEIKTTFQIKEDLDINAFLAKVVFQAKESFINFFLLEKESGLLLGNLVTLQGETEGLSYPLPDVDDEVIRELLSIMLGYYATSMADYLQNPVEMEPPLLERINIRDKDFTAEGYGREDAWAVVIFPLTINQETTISLYQVIPFDSLRRITSSLIPVEQEEERGGETQLQQLEEETAEKETVEQVQERGLEKEPAEGSLFEDGHKDVEVEAAETQDEPKIDEVHKDTMAEVGNISMGSAATTLSQLVNKRIQITTPRVRLTTMGEIRKQYPIPSLVIIVRYLEGLQGENMLIVKETDALTISGLMMGMEPSEMPENLGDMELSALTEAMNQMMGSASTAMSDFLNRYIEISTPQLHHMHLETDRIDLQKDDAGTELQEDSPILQISFRMEIEDLVDSELLHLVPLEFAREITASLFSSLEGTGQDAGGEEAEVAAAAQQEAEQEEEKSVLDDLLVDEVGEAAPTTQESESFISLQGSPSVTREAASEFDEEEMHRLNLIKDIPVEISAVFGKTRVPLKKVFSLSPGEVVSLDRYVGEPVELFANNRLMARGEVVLVNGSFGIKVTEIIRSNS